MFVLLAPASVMEWWPPRIGVKACTVVWLQHHVAVTIGRMSLCFLDGWVNFLRNLFIVRFQDNGPLRVLVHMHPPLLSIELPRDNGPRKVLHSIIAVGVHLTVLLECPCCSLVSVLFALELFWTQVRWSTFMTGLLMGGCIHLASGQLGDSICRSHFCKSQDCSIGNAFLVRIAHRWNRHFLIQT